MHTLQSSEKNSVSEFTSTLVSVDACTLRWMFTEIPQLTVAASFTATCAYQSCSQTNKLTVLLTAQLL